jgi:predicted Fe-S protein YdhL (DUF1289 family)
LSVSDETALSGSDEIALNESDERALSSERLPSVSSPCVSICVLDENDICMGCFRSGDEITDWCILDDEGKKAVLASSAERRADSGLVL